MQLNGPAGIGIRLFHSLELIESRKHTDIWGTNAQGQHGITLQPFISILRCHSNVLL
jgi:hypothetical protein